MTFREAIVRDALGGMLPLKWRRRVSKWQAWNRSQIRKLDQLHRGSHMRWGEWGNECDHALRGRILYTRQPNTITITEES